MIAGERNYKKRPQKRPERKIEQKNIKNTNLDLINLGTCGNSRDFRIERKTHLMLPQF